MVLFAIGIELANAPAVQCPHHANPSEHRRSAVLDHQHQRLDRGLPFRERGFLFWQAGDVVAGVPQRDQRSPVGQQYWILKRALPAFVSHPRPPDTPCRRPVPWRSSSAGRRRLLESAETEKPETSSSCPASRPNPCFLSIH